MSENDSSPNRTLRGNNPAVNALGDAPPLPGLALRRAQDPCVFVIFGASGDLTGRKLIPGLYNLACQELLPARFAVVGFAITPLANQGFRAARTR